MFDKDLSSTLGTVVPLIDRLILTQPDGERSATPEKVLSFVPQEYAQRASCVAGVENALIEAQEIATEDDLIVVGGSLYLLGAIRYLLKGDLV